MLPEPLGNQAFYRVSVLEAGFIQLPLAWYIQDADPRETRIVPSMVFCLQHSVSKHYIVFDLGLRKDTESYPPSIRSLIAKAMPVIVPRSVDESLMQSGVKPRDVKLVILSHLHFDHIGDATSFTNATFVLGEGSDELLINGYPTNSKSDFLKSSVPHERTRVLTREDFETSIGPFPRAHDLFGDGSLYVIDAAGHCKGHINVLARTSSDGSWIYLAGDAAHDVRLLTGEARVGTYIGPDGTRRSRHADLVQTEEHIRRISRLLGISRVQVVIAHDWEWYTHNRNIFASPIPSHVKAKL
ncbi:hypothetical protein CERSUDRAFT_134355 [Gelatoporia subvermispora B]|uniref:Metallo-beta-lactamase domain-containing protein n=1 Tax=Ceriporiopsis subvermispora (strain B) TaxID=914234 RepID=M2RLH8_CERS8|nr:hypothetical protein CERSUDRAFT_134355 [Gelatoporia subvermispora B]